VNTSLFLVLVLFYRWNIEPKLVWLDGDRTEKNRRNGSRTGQRAGGTAIALAWQMRRDVSNSRRCGMVRLGVGICLILAAAMGGCTTAGPSARTEGAPGTYRVAPAARGSEAVFAGEQVRSWLSDGQAMSLAEATRRDDALGYEPNGPLFDDGWITRPVPSIERPRYVFMGSVRSNFFVFFRPDNRR